MATHADFATLTFNERLGDSMTDLEFPGPHATFVGNKSTIKHFTIEGAVQAPAYLLIQTYDVEAAHHRILLNGADLPGPDLPIHPSGQRWQLWLKLIDPGTLHQGTNTIQILKNSPLDNFIVGSVVITWHELESADPCGGCASALNLHSLGEFGPYGNVADAQATLKDALTAMISQGGGVLCIPPDAPIGFYPRHSAQAAADAPSVTIWDFRGGATRIHVPPMGASNTESTVAGGAILERDLSKNLSWQGVYSAANLASRCTGGASSFSSKLTQDVVAGIDRRFYVPSVRGLFVDQLLLVGGGEPEKLKVKELGRDATGFYFVADAGHAHHAGAQVYNKNVVNALSISDTSNCDNQSMSLTVDRTTYGTGDSFAFAGTLRYQGNIMSGFGDEGGVGASIQLIHDLDCFRGEVESWNPSTRALVYKTSAAAQSTRSPQKVGTSRPLVNLNPAKWITAGHIIVIPPNYDPKGEYARPSSVPSDYHVIIGTKEVVWDAAVIGRFIAVDEPSEYYTLADGTPSQRVYRFWHITGLAPHTAEDDNPTGLWMLFVERTSWCTSTRNGLSLIKHDNYTTYPDHIRPLRYIIAPGAWVSDVRQGVSGTTPGNIGQALAADPRTLILAPSLHMGASPVDLTFEPGDPILNPPGADVWQPSGFRVRHFENYTGMMKGASFLSENLGSVQVGAGLHIQGVQGTLDQVAAYQKDGQPSFDTGIYLFASCYAGIRIRGPVRDAAIELWQPLGNPQPIVWRHQGKGGVSMLHAHPETGHFTFYGGDLNYQNNGTLNLRGLSSTGVPANNLRGNKTIQGNTTQQDILFATAEPDANYSVFIESSWVSARAVQKKTSTGFTVVFEEPSPAGGGELDWFLVR
jgi:hypothetical protein